MTQAVVVHEVGDTDVLKWEAIDVGSPSENEVRLRHTAIGLNFIDIYFRQGVYPPPNLPFVPGLEGAGIVETVGPGVTELSAGDRVAYASAPLGAYCEERLMPADRLVRLPDAIDEKVAAAMMLKGMTAEYLLRRTYRVTEGDTILFHAAAGGVGLIACQWAAHLGATVIGTVSTEEKAALAREHGCEHVILYRDEDFVARVNEITEGNGVDVVYDSVGKDTFLRGLDCLRPRGMMVLFGQSSGKPDPIDPGLLSGKGSLYLTRPTIMTYTSEAAELAASAESLFEVMSSGAVKADVNQEYPLSDAAAAHADLEARRTTGATVLIP